MLIGAMNFLRNTLAACLLAASGCVDYDIVRDTQVEESDRSERAVALHVVELTEGVPAGRRRFRFERRLSGWVTKTTRTTERVEFTYDSMTAKAFDEPEGVLLAPIALAWDLLSFGLTAPFKYPAGWIAMARLPDEPTTALGMEAIDRREAVPPGTRLILGAEDSEEVMDLEISDETEVLDMDAAAILRQAREAGRDSVRLVVWWAGRPDLHAAITLR
jgi:hypothetical protein